MSPSPVPVENNLLGVVTSPPRAAVACITCRIRKRKCNKDLPRCSNCVRLKRECLYRSAQPHGAARNDYSHIETIEDSILGSRRHGLYMVPAQTAGQLLDEATMPDSEKRHKAPVTVCERCRSQKRACDKLWPSCSRCKRNRVLCTYLSRPEVNPYSLINQESIMDRLWTGIVDPFQTHPLSLPPDLVNHCNIYRISVLAPSLTPRASNISEIPIVQYWFPPTYNDATLFVTTLLCVLSHQRRRWLLSGQTADSSCRPQDIRWIDWCYLEGIRKINRALNDKESAVTDNMILNVLILAAADGEVVSASACNSPFNAPLRSLQWLDIYSSVSTKEIHLRGLIQLIRLRGGVERIQLPALAAVLCFFELINCSKTLLKPLLPFVSLQDGQKFIPCQFFMFDATTLPHRYRGLQDVGCPEAYLAVFHAMKIHLSVLQRYTKGQLSNPDLRQICDGRNYIQHSLLSVRHDLECVVESQINLFEACRLSALILSTGVMFPLSGSVAPFSVLANMLRTELERSGVFAMNLDSEIVDILVWILTLGGIAAMQMPARHWFVARLSAVTSNYIAQWTKLKEKLEDMLWLDTACSSAGEHLWKEVESLRS